MTTTTRTDQKATAQGIIDNAIAAYAQIDQDERHNHATIATAEEKLQRLALSDTDANNHLATLQRSFDAAEQKYKEASSYAELAANTPGERNAIIALKDAEKVRDETQKTLKLGQQAHENTTRVNAEQRQALTTEVAGCHEHLQQLAHRRQHLSYGQTQAQAEIGDLTAHEARERIDGLKTAIAEKQREITALDEALQTAVSEETQRLTEWPELALEIKNSIVHEDASTKVMEAALNYFDALITHGKQCAVDRHILYDVRRVYELFELFDIAQHELQDAFNPYSGVMPRAAMETRDNIQQVLERYRQAQTRHI